MRIRVWDDGILQPGTNEHHTLIIHGCKDDTGLILSLAPLSPQTRISPTSQYRSLLSIIAARLENNLTVITLLLNSQHVSPAL